MTRRRPLSSACLTGRADISSPSGNSQLERGHHGGSCGPGTVRGQHHDHHNAHAMQCDCCRALPSRLHHAAERKPSHKPAADRCWPCLLPLYLLIAWQPVEPHFHLGQSLAWAHQPTWRSRKVKAALALEREKKGRKRGFWHGKITNPRIRPLPVSSLRPASSLLFASRFWTPLPFPRLPDRDQTQILSRLRSVALQLLNHARVLSLDRHKQAQTRDSASKDDV